MRFLYHTFVTAVAAAAVFRALKEGANTASPPIPNAPVQPLPALGDWSLSDEREFMEDLLCQRFNFFLVVFSLVLTAAFTAQAQLARTLVLCVGVLISFFVWLTIYRAHVKHHWIMQHLYGRSGHPAATVNNAIKDGKTWAFRSVSRYVGVGIPWLCIVIQLVLAVASSIGLLDK